jgi:hypothetical protein
VVRIVILGASNVARGIGTIVDVARHAAGGPVEIVAAMGHGRSYGLTTSIPFRTLPSIRDCGLWSALSNRPALPTWSLLTDVGNDLLYGCPPAQVAQWVHECAGRLRGLSTPLAFTALPLQSIHRVGALRFHAFRRVLFPKSKLQLSVAKQYALELDAAVRRLAEQHAAELIAPSATWYGFDPIHIRVAVQRHAWQTIFSSLARKDFLSEARARATWREWYRVMTMRAERSIVYGRAREAAQPAVMLADGSTVSFF